jgi:hypothetical protein
MGKFVSSIWTINPNNVIVGLDVCLNLRSSISIANRDKHENQDRQGSLRKALHPTIEKEVN